MKKKLFAVAMVLLLYCVFIVLFAMVDNQGRVSKVLSNMGLIDDSARASPSSSQENLLATKIKGNIIDPTPDPPRPPPPDVL